MKTKLTESVKQAIVNSGLRSGMTISFHHHLRNGDYVSKKASYITKAVGGVGPMTVAMLMTNLVDCAEHELNARNARLTNC